MARNSTSKSTVSSGASRQVGIVLVEFREDDFAGRGDRAREPRDAFGDVLAQERFRHVSRLFRTGPHNRSARWPASGNRRLWDTHINVRSDGMHTMSGPPSRPADPPRGWVTLALTFAFVAVFRLEQNVAYALDISTRELVGLDAFPVGAAVAALAPLLHANAEHLVSTLVWLVPFGYFLERRTNWEDYLGFVVLAGVLSTTLVPAVFVVLGVPAGLAIGASGVTHALVGREAAARLSWVLEGRSLSRIQRAVLAVALAGLALKLLGFVPETPPETSVVGHATGLVVGVAAGVAERHVSVAVE
jgi:membrane associated rhomboid family serine protease